jgi:Ser/Thr protein kinase RdoA (MazF antagonist)
MGTLNRNNLRKSIIHGDFQGRNLLITKNKLEAIVDWDDMHKDYISCEIAVFLMHCFELSNPKNDKKYIELFFKEYQKHLELNEDEKKMIYHLIKRRFLGVIFWFKKQIEIHKDREKKLTKKINRVIKRYLAFEDISLNEFMTLTK